MTASSGPSMSDLAGRPGERFVVAALPGASPPTLLQTLADIPEEEIWLAQQKSARTRRAYKLDVRQFMHTLVLTTSNELRRVDHRAVIAWEPTMRETEHAAAATIRRRLSALSSLFAHLVRDGLAQKNPLREIARPRINRDTGTTLAFSKAQARKSLDTPSDGTIAGLRDRAILSVGLQVGLRRAEIAALTVGDLRQNRGFDAPAGQPQGGHPRRAGKAGLAFAATGRMRPVARPDHAGRG